MTTRRSFLVAFACLPFVHRAAADRAKRVLFVCTGNYYRSRFAQAVFNDKTKPGWSAFSRGLDTSTPRTAPVSPLVTTELQRRHIDVARVAGVPQPLLRKDLDDADIIVLLDGAEHEPMLRKRFPDFPVEKVRSWSIGDVPKVAPADAFAAIWKQTETLLVELGVR